MGIGGLGMWEIILIFMVVLLLFGAKRLPEIGSALGKGIREFKGSVREIENELKVPDDRKGMAPPRHMPERTLRAEEPVRAPEPVRPPEEVRTPVDQDEKSEARTD
jgi:sec-independent protein translocase protein TatA